MVERWSRDRCCSPAELVCRSAVPQNIKLHIGLFYLFQLVVTAHLLLAGARTSTGLATARYPFKTNKSLVPLGVVGSCVTARMAKHGERGKRGYWTACDRLHITSQANQCCQSQTNRTAITNMRPCKDNWSTLGHLQPRSAIFE